MGEEWRPDIDSFCQRLIDEGLSPGMGIAIAAGDQVVYEKGFGSADTASSRPVNDSTRFYIASTTKSLTATAVLLASHRGEIDLKKPVSRYLPKARFPEGISPTSILVRDLLTLTHGLSGAGPVVFRTAYSGDFTMPQLLELLRFHEPTGDKGTFDYNNLGYNLLGMILEARYGKSWKDVVRKEVLEPLAMKNTTAYSSRLETAQIAFPHALGPHGWHTVYLAKEDANLHAAGGHFATAGDMARYLAVHISGGKLEGKQILPRDPILETHKKHVAQDLDFGPIHRFGWGYGFDLGTYEDDVLIHRFGAFSGYRSHVSFMPEQSLGVAVLVNGDGPAFYAVDLAAFYIYDRLLGRSDAAEKHLGELQDLKIQAEKYRQKVAVNLEERKKRQAPLPHPLKAYAGVYENSKLGSMEWRAQDGGLEVKMGVMHSRAEIYNAEKNQLRIELRGGGEVMTFQFAQESKQATSLLYLGETFKRQ
jgi:CubicO group peptidase (beta-lactamase class C family)